MNGRKINSLGIWGNTDKPKFWQLLDPLIKWANQNKIETYITTRIKDKTKEVLPENIRIIEKADDFLKTDFLIAMGGDGTILSAARAVGSRGTPIFGVHLGELGFMADVIVENMFERLDQIANGSFSIQERMLLKAEIHNSEEGKIFYCLNDFVIDRGKYHRILTMRLNSDDRHIADYDSDGLIISTPTGSTAYSLSAGGPIVWPKLNAIVVTPISPHTLTLRPLVLSDDSNLEISFPKAKTTNIALAVDGQVENYLQNNSKIKISKAPYSIKMLDFEDSNYFSTLRKKMGWGKRGDI